MLMITFAFIFSSCHEEKQAYNIGHIGPLTGGDALFGQWEKEGIDFAIKKINEVDSSFIMKIYHDDDQSKPTRSLSSLQKLINFNKIVAVIGPTLSSSVLACDSIANQNKVPLITPSAQSPKLINTSNYIFTLFVSSIIEAKYLANVADTLKFKKVAIISHSSDYGVGLKNILKTKLNEKEINITSIETYPINTKNFRPFLANIKATKPDALFLLAFPEDITQILIQAKQLHLDATLIAPDSFEADEIINIAKNASEGVIYIYPVLPESDSFTQKIREDFEKQFNAKMNIYNATSYDATMLLYKTIKLLIDNGETISGENIKNELLQIKNYSGLSGIINFDDNGNVVDRLMEIRIVKNGKYQKF
jgi:branched-chain amino acid transport system substrate-binding protein